MATLLQLRTRLRYRLDDVDTANPRIVDANYNTWINSALKRIAREALCFKDTDTITGDGSTGYTLIGTLATNLASDYYLMHGVDVDYSAIIAWTGTTHKILRQVDIERIREEVVAVSGTLPADELPTMYALYGNTIYLNAQIVAGAIIHGRYFGTPVALTVDGTSPEAPLDTWDSLVVAAARLEHTVDEEGGNLDSSVVVGATKEYQTELKKFLQFFPNESYGTARQERG